jgi:MFS family permease
MIQQILHRLLLRRHFWRHATFSEVAELYASRMLRMLAVNMSSALLSVFLYQNGYSLQFIAGYWAIYFGLKVLMSLPAAKYAARFGPKHGILLSNLLYIPAMIAFIFVPTWGIWAIMATGLLQGASATLYDLCHLIDFSKVKNVEHAGKEIGYMNMVEKVATGLSPLIGGFIALVFGPQATMVAAALFFAFASVPLFRTGEQMQVGKKLVFRGFPWRMAIRSLIAEVGMGVDSLVSSSVWSLYVAVAILGVQAHSNAVYAQLGTLLSVMLLAALAASYAYGRLIDRRRGGDLLRITVIANALVHATRPFITTPITTAALNVANEAATTGYMMAFTRGMFETADLSGHRVTYLFCIEAVLNLGAALAGGLLLVLISLMHNPLDAMKMLFFVTAVVSLLIATPKFQLYRR